MCQILQDSKSSRTSIKGRKVPSQILIELNIIKIPSKRKMFIRSIPRSISPLRTTRQYSNPPSYFSQHNDKPPKPIFTEPSTASPPASTAVAPVPNPTPRSNTSRDLSLILAVVVLAYLTVDNYRTRLLLESKIQEQQLIHMKSLAIAQNTYNTHRKKREMQIINERKNTQRRDMKMIYHISMLRKQLIDAGLKPIEIDEAIAEFEKNVKMETSISNVSGTALWVVDDSPMKAYAPNIHDYESKKK